VIVVDTNVIASLLLPTNEHSKAAMDLLERDRDWAAPVLWRSEFCNLLATAVRNSWLSEDQAKGLLSSAEELMIDGDYRVPADQVLSTAITSRCTAYDCEFVVLAKDLGVDLITADRALLRAFPEIAKPLAVGDAA
jgi:predicted nucleic acid-binding protein